MATGLYNCAGGSEVRLVKYERNVRDLCQAVLLVRFVGRGLKRVKVDQARSMLCMDSHTFEVRMIAHRAHVIYLLPIDHTAAADHEPDVNPPYSSFSHAFEL
jgi:hypothetical protein